MDLTGSAAGLWRSSIPPRKSASWAAEQKPRRSNGHFHRGANLWMKRWKSGTLICLSVPGETNLHPRLHFRLRQAGMPLEAVSTMFDFIDRDEGRNLHLNFF